MIDAQVMAQTKFKMAAAAILNLLPVAILTILSTVNHNHHIKFRADVSIGDRTIITF